MLLKMAPQWLTSSLIIIVYLTAQCIVHTVRYMTKWRTLLELLEVLGCAHTRTTAFCITLTEPSAVRYNERRYCLQDATSVNVQQ